MSVLAIPFRAVSRLNNRLALSKKFNIGILLLISIPYLVTVIVYGNLSREIRIDIEGQTKIDRAAREAFEYRATMLYTMMWVAWGSTAVWGLFLIYYFTTRTFLPIERLARLASRISMGKPAHMPRLNRDDELGRLYGAVKEMEENLLQDVRHLKEVNQFKSEFLSMITHQLRAPLSSLKLAIELTLMKDQLQPEQEERLKNMGASVEQLARLVNNLLRMAKLEIGGIPVNKQGMNIAVFIQDQVRVLQSKADGRKQHIITYGLESAMQTVSFDPDLMSEAFQNILDNGLQYAPDASTISVRLRKDKDMYVIGITNDGPAIAEEEREKIFTKFYRSAASQAAHPGGSGLGLFIAKAAIEAHGGRMWFESPVQNGRGVTFYIAIPT